MSNMSNIVIDRMKNAPDTRSELMKAKEKAMSGKVNACPFGCDFKHLDEHGYCKHLIGFSNDRRTFEPMVRDQQNRRRLVRPKMKTVQEVAEYDDDGKPVMADVREPMLDKILPGDVLVRISTSYRVYRGPGRDAAGAAPQRRTEFKKPTEEEKEALIRREIEAPPAPGILGLGQHIPETDFAVVDSTEGEELWQQKP